MLLPDSFKGLGCLSALVCWCCLLLLPTNIAKALATGSMEKPCHVPETRQTVQPVACNSCKISHLSVPKQRSFATLIAAWYCNGQIVGQPRKWECPKNVEKLSEKCPKIVQRGWKHNFRTFFGQFLPIWSMLLFGDPVQCAPVTSLVQPLNSRIAPKSVGEGASSRFGGWPGSPDNVSCSRATPRLHGASLGLL